MLEELVLTIPETAKLLRRERTTVYRMIRRGELKPVRYGGRMSIPTAQVLSLAGAA